MDQPPLPPGGFLFGFQLRMLGSPAPDRLAIVSLGLRHPRGLLHSAFVVALLNDLFGIQARSGCFCAGPYVHRLFPIHENLAFKIDVEAYNLLNHPVLGSPASAVTTPSTFGTITTTAFGNAQRILQFAGKIQF